VSNWLLPTVTASTMIAQVMGCAQGQMSQWACGNLSTVLLNGVGVIWSDNSLYVPVPDKGTLCGLPPPVSVTVTAAERVPVAVGLKITLMVQLLFPARLLPQLLVWEKSPGFVPVMLIAVMETAVVPTFVTVTGAEALDVPTF
jgi:hypothetical protein